MAIDFGSILRNLRIQKHLSQNELGRRIHKSPNVISRYENETQSPTLDVLISLSKELNISIPNLIGTEMSPSIKTESSRDLAVRLQLLTESHRPLSDKEKLEAILIACRLIESIINNS